MLEEERQPSYTPPYSFGQKVRGVSNLDQNKDNPKEARGETSAEKRQREQAYNTFILRNIKKQADQI